MAKKKTDVDELERLPETTPELEASKAVIRRLRAENRQLAKSVGNWEALSAEIVRYAPALKPPKRQQFRQRPSKYKQEMVALLSDAHATERWTKAETDGMTAYDFETFCSHLWYFGEEIVRLVHEDRGKYGLRTLHVDMLGDMHHGTLRLDDEVTNEFATVPGIINTSYVLYQWLLMLLGHFSSVKVTCMAGNHGRFHRKPQSKRYVEENRDTLVYLIIRSMARAAKLEGRLSINVPKSRVHTLERLGHRIKVGHGDHVRSGNSIANLPIYGLSREILRQYRKEILRAGEAGLSLIEYGHWHHYNFLEDILIVNGAMRPTDPWAFDELGAIADPTQLVYYTSERFVIGWRNHLNLKHGVGVKHRFAYDTDSMFAETTI